MRRSQLIAIFAAIVFDGLATFAYLALLPRSPFVLAYIDPGVGAMLVQVVVAAFFGLIFYIKSVRTWIARTFMRLLGKAPAKPNEKVESR